MLLDTTYQNILLEAGCDEAGRGPLSGSLFAASVILPFDFHDPLLNDSKKMTEKHRYKLRSIIEREAIAWAVDEVTIEEIDRINILNASFLGMSRATQKLSTPPELLLIDGNRFKSELTIPFECIIKGDGKYANIAAASVLAKTYRDDYMIKIAEEYPEYKWAKNKGYPTLEHRKAIMEHGISPYHRRTFCSKFIEPTLWGV